LSYFVHDDGFVRHNVWVWDAISLAVAYDRILHTQHVKTGGQFEPDSAGQFAPVFSGQFKSVSGGQYHRIFHLLSYLNSHNVVKKIKNINIIE